MDTSKYFIHAERIGDEEIKPLIEFINNTEGHLTIGLNSSGGGRATACFLLNLLNENCERIKLVAMSGIYSAAFKIFAEFKGYKAITYGAVGMWHMSSYDATINEDGSITFLNERTVVNSNKKLMKQGRQLAKKVMTPKEYKKFKKGRDIYFDFNRMKKIFPKAEILI